MIDEQHLARLAFFMLNGGCIDPGTAGKLIRLARLGLWAEKHAVPVIMDIPKLASVYGRDKQFPSNKDRKLSMAPRGQRHKVWDILNQKTAEALAALPKDER